MQKFSCFIWQEKVLFGCKESCVLLYKKFYLAVERVVFDCIKSRVWLYRKFFPGDWNFEKLEDWPYSGQSQSDQSRYWNTYFKHFCAMLINKTWQRLLKTKKPSNIKATLFPVFRGNRLSSSHFFTHSRTFLLLQLLLTSYLQHVSGKFQKNLWYISVKSQDKSQ